MHAQILHAIQQMTDAGRGLLGTEVEWQQVVNRALATPRYLETARTKLYNLGMFSSVRLDAHPNAQHPDEADVVVRISQKDSSILAIDREAEHANSKAAAESGASPRVVEYAPDDHLLVVESCRHRVQVYDRVAYEDF